MRKFTWVPLRAAALFILPESPRWLVVNSRLDEALAVIKRILASTTLPDGDPAWPWCCLCGALPVSIKHCHVLDALEISYRILTKTLFCKVWPCMSLLEH